jgi:hypothetical protein
LVVQASPGDLQERGYIEHLAFRITSICIQAEGEIWQCMMDGLYSADIQVWVLSPFHFKDSKSVTGVFAGSIHAFIDRADWDCDRGLESISIAYQKTINRRVCSQTQQIMESQIKSA